MAKPINRPGDDIDFLTKELRARGLPVDSVRLTCEPGADTRTADVNLRLFDPKVVASADRGAAQVKGHRAWKQLRAEGIEDGDYLWWAINGDCSYGMATLRLERQYAFDNPRPLKPSKHQHYVEELEEILPRALNIKLRSIKVTESCEYRHDGRSCGQIHARAEVRGRMYAQDQPKLFDMDLLQVPGKPYAWVTACGEVNPELTLPPVAEVSFMLTRVYQPDR